MSGPDVAYAAIGLRACLAMSGTHMAYATTRPFSALDAIGGSEGVLAWHVQVRGTCKLFSCVSRIYSIMCTLGVRWWRIFPSNAEKHSCGTKQTNCTKTLVFVFDSGVDNGVVPSGVHFQLQPLCSNPSSPYFICSALRYSRRVPGGGCYCKLRQHDLQSHPSGITGSVSSLCMSSVTAPVVQTQRYEASPGTSRISPCGTCAMFCCLRC